MAASKWSMLRTPVIPVMWGSTTVWVTEAARAASQALPPSRRILTASRVARGCEQIAIPVRDVAGVFGPK